jgi:hypothetical protein
VARRLGLPVEERDIVARAAELHDIGKMAIPDAILNKAGPLDDREWRFMRRHTIIGEDILNVAPGAPAGGGAGAREPRALGRQRATPTAPPATRFRRGPASLRSVMRSVHGAGSSRIRRGSA